MKRLLNRLMAKLGYVRAPAKSELSTAKMKPPTNETLEKVIAELRADKSSRLARSLGQE